MRSAFRAWVRGPVALLLAPAALLGVIMNGTSVPEILPSNPPTVRVAVATAPTEDSDLRVLPGGSEYGVRVRLSYEQGVWYAIVDRRR